MARLGILLAAMLFSTGGAAIKATTLSSWQVASFRSGVAALAVLLLMPEARRRWGWQSLAVGGAYAATLVLYVLANKLTTAASTIFLQSTAPLYVLLLSPWLLKEPVRRRDLLYMAVMATGLALFFVEVDPVHQTAPDPFRGNVLATLAGVGWALTVLGLRWMGRDPATSGTGSGAAAIFLGNVLACLVALPWALPVAEASLSDWTVVAYLGIFQIGLAYRFLTPALGQVPALEASLLLLLEPVLNPLWAGLLHGERPGPWSVLGGVIILLGTAVKTWYDFRAAPLGIRSAPP